MGCKIIIPSRKRSEILTTEIEGSILFVAESEFDDYKKTQSEKYEIETHPNLKSLAEIRNFIFNRYGDVFMVDDDIVSVERLYCSNDQILTQNEIIQIINEAYYNSKQIGSSLFGFNNDPSPTHYNQHKPFMLNGYINGCAFGLIKDEKLFFTNKTTACESHWINLLNAHYNRFCFIDKRFHFRQKPNSTFTLEGGQTGKRTMETEKKDTLFLKMMFGDSVQIKKAKNKTLQIHEYQRQLNIRL